MRLFEWAKDGGKDSPVDAFFFFFMFQVLVAVLESLNK
jgi:hypothetical protein